VYVQDYRYSITVTVHVQLLVQHSFIVNIISSSLTQCSAGGDQSKVNMSCDKPRFAQGFPFRLRPRISWRFVTTRVVGRQPNVSVVFAPGEIPGTDYESLSHLRAQGSLRRSTEKVPSDTTGIDPVISRLVAQCLNHYATPGPWFWPNVDKYICNIMTTHNSTYCYSAI